METWYLFFVVTVVHLGIPFNHPELCVINSIASAFENAAMQLPLRLKNMLYLPLENGVQVQR